MGACAQANFRSWNDALQTKDPATVARLYSPRDLSFLPTVSPMHISKMEDTNDYFTAFVKKDPFGTITDESVQVYDNGNAYLHSGMYTFDLGQGIARAPVEARFSYMWRLEDDAWKISHHHSSVRPLVQGGSQTANGHGSVREQRAAAGRTMSTGSSGSRASGLSRPVSNGQLSELYDFDAHNRALEESFPRVVPEAVLIDHVAEVLEKHGFDGASAINLVSTDRDELCRPVKFAIAFPPGAEGVRVRAARSLHARERAILENGSLV